MNTDIEGKNTQIIDILKINQTPAQQVKRLKFYNT